jgi:hypothetical protein
VHPKALAVVETKDALEKSEGTENDPKIVGVRLAMAALWYSIFQLAIDWLAYFIFSTNVELSRFVHSFLRGMDNLTPALTRLKAFYHAPISGREFSQVFAIYLFLFGCLCLCFAALLGLLVRGNVSSVRWKRVVRPVYLILLFLLGLGCWGIYFFVAVPSEPLRDYFGMFGSDFIRAVCVSLPLGQFLILFSLALYYAIGVIHTGEAGSR